MSAQEVNSLEELLDRLDGIDEDQERVSLRSIIDIVGARSFGPVLLVLGLIPLSPLSGIPGISTAVAVMVLLLAGQLIIGRGCCWLPQFLLRRSVPRPKLQSALGFLRPVARWVDKLLRRRLAALTSAAAIYVIAVLCAVISVAMPLLEVIPFANSTAGAALASFGLALIAHDGVLVLLTGIFCAVTMFFLFRVLV